MKHPLTSIFLRRAAGVACLFLTAVMAKAEQPDKLFVVNEGAFGNNNASLTVHYPQSGQTVQNVFHTVNNTWLGDVANDAKWINGYLYVVINNSHKIEVIDPDDYTLVSTIHIDSDEHGGSPRKLAQVSDNKAYVTNLYGNNVSVMDLATGQETGTISLGAGSGPEDMVVTGGYAFVALSELGGGNSVAVIDTETDEWVDTIETGDNPTWMALSPDGNVWSVATGNYGYDENWQYDPELETFGEIHIIDPVAKSVIDTVFVGGHPGRIAFIDDDTALIQQSGLLKINVQTKAVEEEPWLDRRLYAFSIDRDGETPSVYIMEAPDFASAGRVIQLDKHAAVVDSFQAGIGPSSMAFWRQGEPTIADNAPEMPKGFQLNQNYPNPFNPSTTMSFTIPETAHVRLEVFDAMGRRVDLLMDETMAAGSHHVEWNSRGFSSGSYFYRLSVDGVSAVRAMTLMK